MDIQVAGRALSFLAKPLTGEVTMGIVYSRANAQSIQDAQDLERQLEGGLRVGNLTLKPILVAVGEATRANVSLFFVTPGAPVPTPRRCWRSPIQNTFLALRPT